MRTFQDDERLNELRRLFDAETPSETASRRIVRARLFGRPERLDEVPGYRLLAVEETSARSVVYCALRLSDGRPVRVRIDHPLEGDVPALASSDPDDDGYEWGGRVPGGVFYVLEVTVAPASRLG